MNVKINSLIEINQILAIYDDRRFFKIGDPFIPHTKIVVKVISHSQEKKIQIIKFRRRKHSRKKQGHRQKFTMIKVKKLFQQKDKKWRTKEQAVLQEMEEILNQKD
ncbi:LSU ribosomal protein L21p [Candidatus Riesia pediculischaeffi PTSU]|uniref:50S ribosomal protein L21 n=1 Tax=Candidatus Riesia pediculischaeffi PTSU TaxID=1401651 RepID=A0A0C1S980_9ENTR|nr:LSU ribosomal protein L21p [Candidatus Riesia pediculischaeffi PTSU]